MRGAGGGGGGGGVLKQWACGRGRTKSEFDLVPRSCCFFFFPPFVFDPPSLSSRVTLLWPG